MAYANDDQNLIEAQKQEMQELNPFWMKFLQPEKYYGGNQEIALLIVGFILNNNCNFY